MVIIWALQSVLFFSLLQLASTWFCQIPLYALLQTFNHQILPEVCSLCHFDSWKTLTVRRSDLYRRFSSIILTNDRFATTIDHWLPMLFCCSQSTPKMLSNLLINLCLFASLQHVTINQRIPCESATTVPRPHNPPPLPPPPSFPRIPASLSVSLPSRRFCFVKLFSFTFQPKHPLSSCLGAKPLWHKT